MAKFSTYHDRYRFYRLDRDDAGILTVTLHTDGGPMVWGLEPIEELGHLWADVAADRENQAVIVTGTGDGFIKDIAVAGDGRMSAAGWDKIADDVRRVINNHLNVPVPMIAAVNGPVRFHSEQALLCDIVIASRTAEFQDAPHYVAGMVPGDGIQIIYTHLLGANRARYFLLTGQVIGAEEALRDGLISEVHASDALMPRARELAGALLLQPDLVRRYTRRVCVEPLRRLYGEYLDQGLSLEGLGAWGGWPFET